MSQTLPKNRAWEAWSEESLASDQVAGLKKRPVVAPPNQAAAPDQIHGMMQVWAMHPVDISKLTPQQIDDLVEYVLSL